MQIIIDKQEKKPLEFNHEYVESTSREHLKTGDYRARFKNGKLSKVVFERKAADLCTSLTSGYRRFRNEFQRAEQEGISLIICIEGSYRKVKGGRPRWTKPGIQLCDQLRTIWAKYGVTHHYFVDRAQMSEFIVDTFIWCYKKGLYI